MSYPLNTELEVTYKIYFQACWIVMQCFLQRCTKALSSTKFQVSKIKLYFKYLNVF